MASNSTSGTGKDAIKGGIFFGSNLTPTGAFENVPQFTKSAEYTTSSEPRITMTLALFREQLQNDAKTKNQSSTDVLSEASVTAFLVNYVQLLIDYKDLRNFIFFGSSIVEMKYQIDYLRNNYPYKAFIARDITEPYLLTLINYTDSILGAVTDLVFRFDDIQQGANYAFDVTGKTLWPNFEVQDADGNRHPITTLNNAITSNLDIETFPSITFHREVGGNDYGVEELKIDDILTFVDRITGDIKATARVSSGIVQSGVNTVCVIDPLIWTLDEFGIPIYTSLTAGVVGDYVITPASICSITVDGAFTINDYIQWFKNDLEHFKGFVITPTIARLVDFESNLDGIKKLLLDALNPMPWPRSPITNNLIIEDEDYDNWLMDPNNLIINYNPDKDGLAGEPNSGFNMVSAWTMDESATNQLLMRCIPHRLVDEINDIDDRYFTRFIWLAGKMFDTVKLYIDFLKYTHTLNYTEFNQLSPEFYKQYANHYGFDLLEEDNIDFSKTLIFTEPGLAYDNQANPVYSNEYTSKTLRALQYERQKRLLINLFYLYQKKGTIQCIEYLANLIGSPRGLVLVEEYALDVSNPLSKTRVVDNVKIHVPTYDFEPDPNFPRPPDQPPIYRIKLNNEKIQNLREISINIDVLNAITEDILRYGQVIYSYGFLREKTFANLQNPDNDYYLLPLSFPDKFNGITFNYNIPRNGLRHGWASNDSEITFNLPSVYKVKPISNLLHINSITINVANSAKTDIAINLLNTPLGSTTLSIIGASELIPDGIYNIEDTTNTTNETIFTINFDISASLNTYLELGSIVTLLPAIVNKNEKFNYKIPPIFLTGDEFPNEKTVDEMITYKATTHITLMDGMVDLLAKDTKPGSIQIEDGDLVPLTTIISAGWTWSDTTLEENVIKIVDSITNTVTIPNFVAAYTKIDGGFLITIEYEYTSLIGIQPYNLQVLIDDGSGLLNDIDFLPVAFTTYIPSVGVEEYIIARLEGRDLVVRLSLLSESLLVDQMVNRVAIFEDYFDNDGLNHMLKLIYRPEGVEVYKDYKYLGLARWRELMAGPWSSRNLPKGDVSSCVINPLPSDMFSYPTDTTTTLEDLITPTNDVVDWWDLFIGYGSGIEVYVSKVSIFENLFISQADYLEGGIEENGYEVEKWSFDFGDQVKNNNGVYISDRIEIPCTYRAPNPPPPFAIIDETTALDVFFSNNANKIRLTSKNYYDRRVQFLQLMADFFIVPTGETYSIDTLFKYNAHSSTLHADYTYQNFDKIYDNYYTFAQQVLTYYNLSTFVELVESKFKPLIEQFIPIVINMTSFGKTLKNNIAKVRYPNIYKNCSGHYVKSKAKAQFRIAYGINNYALDINLSTVKNNITHIFGFPFVTVIRTRDEHGLQIGDFVKLDGFFGTTLVSPCYADFNGNTYVVSAINTDFQFEIATGVIDTWIPAGSETITKVSTTLFSGVWGGNNIATAEEIAFQINTAYPGLEIIASTISNVVQLEIDVQGYWNLYGQNINEEKLAFTLDEPVTIDHVFQPTGGHVVSYANNCIVIEYATTQPAIPSVGLFIFYDLEVQLPIYTYYDSEFQPPIYI